MQLELKKIKKPLFNYLSTQITGYRGWILQQYDIACFRDRLEELLASNFVSQFPHPVNLHSQSNGREVYRLKVHLEDQMPDTFERAGHLSPEEVYIKRYYTVNWKQKIQTFFYVHKAQKSWRIGEILVKRGIPTPLPIAYLRRFRKLSVEHVLVTQGIENGIQLSDYVRRYIQANSEGVHERLSLTEKRELIRSVAEFLAQLHTEGIYHGDFTTRNILVDDMRRDQFRIYLIDLDSVRSTRWISDRRRIKNLDELGRNFLDLRVFSTTDRGRFLQHYLRANPKESRTFKSLFRCVLQRTQKRLRKYGKHFSPPPNLSHQGGGIYEEDSHQEGEPYKGWNLFVFPQWKSTFPTIDKVFEIVSNPERIVQENTRGVVLLIRHNGILFVAKRSKIQENKRWAQLTSLYRKGEGTRTLRNMSKLYSLGLPVPEPVLILERKICGFVVASWSLYRYLEGHPCSRTQSHLIAGTLKDMHQKGWVHRDPHVKNFLWDGEKICVVDCAKARPWRSRYAQMYDVVRLNNCCPGSLNFYGISESYWVYRLAKSHNNMIKLWRRIKRIIRRRTPSE